MDNRKQFDGKSEIYSRYRPDYPVDIILLLKENAGFKDDSIIADIGSGTGLFAKLFLRNGNTVYCVEPNSDMRNRAVRDIGEFNNCILVNGSAEKTTLPENAVDFIVAAQSFHWFDPVLAKKEFSRILKPGGFIALVWNDRKELPEGINHDYEAICRKYSKNYHESGSKVLNEEALKNFFNGDYKLLVIEHNQKLDLEGLKGRYFSASYAINEEDDHYEELLKSFEEAFLRNQKNGFVKLEYETKVYLGTLVL